MVTVQTSGTLYAGTNLSLTCTITLEDAVTTDVEMNFQWTPSDDRLSAQSTTGPTPVFTSSVTVSPLTAMDTELTCTAVVRPHPETKFVTDSTSVSESRTLVVESKSFMSLI